MELGKKIMTEFATLRPITYNYLTDDNNQNEIEKDTKICVVKQKLKF